MTQSVLWVTFLLGSKSIPLPVLIRSGGYIDFDVALYMQAPINSFRSQSKLRFEAAIIRNLANACEGDSHSDKDYWSWSDELEQLHEAVVNGSTPAHALYEAREFIAYLSRHGLIDTPAVSSAALRQVASIRRRSGGIEKSSKRSHSMKPEGKPFAKAGLP